MGAQLHHESITMQLYCGCINKQILDSSHFLAFLPQYGTQKRLCEDRLMAWHCTAGAIVL